MVRQRSAMMTMMIGETGSEVDITRPRELFLLKRPIALLLTFLIIHHEPCCEGFHLTSSSSIGSSSVVVGLSRRRFWPDCYHPRSTTTGAGRCWTSVFLSHDEQYPSSLSSESLSPSSSTSILSSEDLANNKREISSLVDDEYNDAFITQLLVKEKKDGWKQAVRLILHHHQQQPILQPRTRTNKSSPIISSENHKDQQLEQAKLEQKPKLLLPLTYQLVIHSCLSSGQVEPAYQVLQSCLGLQKGVITSQSLEQVITALCNKQQWRRALQLLDQQLQLNATIVTLPCFNAILSALSRKGEKQPEAALHLLARLQQLPNIQPNLNSYNSVLQATAAAATKSNWKLAVKVFDQCQRQPGVRPDIYTYTHAIRAIAKGGGPFSQALAMLRAAKDQKLPVDAYIYTATMQACGGDSKNGWKKALELLHEMQQPPLSLRPSSVTYSVCITACGNAGQWKPALELVQEMHTRKIPVNLITYNAAITALARAAKKKSQHPEQEQQEQLWPKVQFLMTQLRNDGLQPDGFTYSSAISCCGAEGAEQWQQALELLEEMKQNGVRPNKMAYSAAISSCGKAGQVDLALQVFDQMKRASSSSSSSSFSRSGGGGGGSSAMVDRVAYNAVFSALRIAQRSDAAYLLWCEMVGKQQQQEQGGGGKKTTTTTTITTRTSGEVAMAMKNRAAPTGTAAAASTTTPDIITVTEAIAAISSSSSENNSSNISSSALLAKERVDEVFSYAFDRGLVLRSNLDSPWDFDLSGLSLPVARAACRFVLHRIAYSTPHSNSNSKSDEGLQDMTFITGVGINHYQRLQQQQQPSTSNHYHDATNYNNRDISLRDYVQEILRDDFDPPLPTEIPARAQGSVQISKEVLRVWLATHRNLKQR